MQSGWWSGILAYDKFRHLGAVAALPKDEGADDLILNLKPVARVHYRVIPDATDIELKRLNMSFYFVPARSLGAITGAQLFFAAAGFGSPAAGEVSGSIQRGNQLADV